MFNFFNSPMLKSVCRTFRPPTLITGGDGSPAPFPLPLPGGIPEPEAVFGAEPSTPPITPPVVALPKLPSFQAQPELDIPPAPPPARVPGSDATVGLVSNHVPNMEPKNSTPPPILAKIGNNMAEEGAEVLQKVVEGREAASKLLGDGKDAVIQRISSGRGAVRQKEELIRRKREAAKARDQQIVGELQKQAEQRKLEKAEERDRNETRKAIEGLGDAEFAATVESTLEDDLKRVHEMSGAEVRELRNRIQRARLAGMGDKASKALSTITSIRTEGLTEKNSVFFPTKALAKRLRHLEEGCLNPVLDGVNNGSLALDAVALAGKRLGKLDTFSRVLAPHTIVPTLVAAGLDQASQATATKFRELLGERAKFGDEEAQQALDRSNRLR